MEIIDTKNLVGGWFVGSFSPTAYITGHCEVAYKHHHPSEDWPAHYHERTDEINYLLTGKMEINGQYMEGPCIFVIKKGEVVKPKFITTVAIIVVKVPGIPNDKVIVDEKAKEMFDSISAEDIMKNVLTMEQAREKEKLNPGSWISDQEYRKAKEVLMTRQPSVEPTRERQGAGEWKSVEQEQVDNNVAEAMEKLAPLKNDFINIIGNKLLGKRKKTPRKAK